MRFIYEKPAQNAPWAAVFYYTPSQCGIGGDPEPSECEWLIPGTYTGD